MKNKKFFLAANVADKAGAADKMRTARRKRKRVTKRSRNQLVSHSNTLGVHLFIGVIMHSMSASVAF